MFQITNQIEKINALTHAGTFHADDVFGAVILKKVFNPLILARVFDVPENLPSGTIVYDIGLGEFDHHQPTGNGARENGVPYASCGLLWKKFGHQIVATTPAPVLVWEILDRDLFQGIDAIDNGALPPRDYPAHPISVSGIISSFNPNWNSTIPSDEAFARALEFAEVVFDNLLENAIAKASAKAAIENAIATSTDQIMVLEEFMPWKEFIFTSPNPKAQDILFVIYPSNRGGFNFQCVPDAPKSFCTRHPTPLSWHGLRGENLQNVTGIQTATFCHSSGFLGSAETLEDAIALARLAIHTPINQKE